jgi:hypothetical protein
MDLWTNIVYGIVLEGGSLDPYQEEGGIHSRPAWLAFTGNSEDGINVESRGCLRDNNFVVIIAQDFSDPFSYEMVTFDPSELIAQPEWNERLRQFCTKYGLKPISEPRWFVCTSWY